MVKDVLEELPWACADELVDRKLVDGARRWNTQYVFAPSGRFLSQVPPPGQITYGSGSVTFPSLGIGPLVDPKQFVVIAPCLEHHGRGAESGATVLRIVAPSPREAEDGGIELRVSR